MRYLSFLMIVEQKRTLSSKVFHEVSNKVRYNQGLLIWCPLPVLHFRDI